MDVPVLGEIRTVADAVRLVERDDDGPLRRLFAGPARGRWAFPRNLWFRGVQEGRSELSPRVFSEVERGIEETELLHEARRLLPAQELGDLPDAEILGVLDHHGCPTRLLDWSESLLLALWFALTDDFARGTSSASRDGALFVLAPLRLNALAALGGSRVLLRESSPDVVLRAALAFETTRSGFRHRIEGPSVRGRMEHPEALGAISAALDGPDRERAALALSTPVAFAARMRTPRIHGQQGVFTIAGGKAYTAAEGEELAADGLLPRPRPLPTALPDGEPIVAQLIVPRDRRERLTSQLVDLGIDPVRMAPGIDGAIATAATRGRS